MEEKMDETLAAFLADIEARSWADVDAIAQSVCREHEEKTDAMRRDAEREAETWRQTELAALEQQSRRTLDERRAETRERLLACRTECEAEAMAALRERLAAYTATEDYRDQLAVLLERGLAALGAKHGPAVAYLRREDMDYAEVLRARMDRVLLTVREGDHTLGGVAVEAPTLGRRADLTFDAAMDDAGARFAEIFGMEIV